MSDVLAAIRAFTKKACASQETAFQTLVEEGIYNHDGTLSYRYGGEYILPLNDEVLDAQILKILDPLFTTRTVEGTFTHIMTGMRFREMDDHYLVIHPFSYRLPEKIGLLLDQRKEVDMAAKPLNLPDEFRPYR